MLPKNIIYHMEEKEFVTAEEERKFWEMNLLGTSSANSLLYTVVFFIIIITYPHIIYYISRSL